MNKLITPIPMDQIWKGLNEARREKALKALRGNCSHSKRKNVKKGSNLECYASWNDATLLDFFKVGQ